MPLLRYSVRLFASAEWFALQNAKAVRCIIPVSLLEGSAARVAISRRHPRQVHIPMIPKNAVTNNRAACTIFPCKPTMNNGDTVRPMLYHGALPFYATIHHAPPITPINTIVVRKPAPTRSLVEMSSASRPTGLWSPPVPAEGSPSLIPPLSAVTGPGT